MAEGNKTGPWSEGNDPGVGGPAVPVGGAAASVPPSSRPEDYAAAAAWYVGHASGDREGPLPMGTLKQRLAAGSLSTETLVWREGLSGWVPARTLPELFDKTATATPSAVPSPPAFDWATTQAQLSQSFLYLLGTTRFYRMLGWAAGALAVPLLLLGPFCLLLYSDAKWLFLALNLVTLFVVGHATATILTAIQRPTVPKETKEKGVRPPR